MRPDYYAYIQNTPVLRPRRIQAHSRREADKLVMELYAPLIKAGRPDECPPELWDKHFGRPEFLAERIASSRRHQSVKFTTKDLDGFVLAHRHYPLIAATLADMLEYERRSRTAQNVLSLVERVFLVRFAAPSGKELALMHPEVSYRDVREFVKCLSEILWECTTHRGEAFISDFFKCAEELGYEAVRHKVAADRDRHDPRQLELALPIKRKGDRATFARLSQSTPTFA